MSCHGRILWTELNTRDPEKAMAFYGTAFGWTFEPTPMGDSTYWLAKAQGADMATAGIFTMSGPYFDGVPDHWLTYFGQDDVDAGLAKVSELGGTVLRPAWDIPGVGRIAIVRGASGAGEGWMTPAPGMGPAT